MGLFNFFASSAPDSSSPGLACAPAADVGAVPVVVAAAVVGPLVFEPSCAYAGSAMPTDRSPSTKARRPFMTGAVGCNRIATTRDEDEGAFIRVFVCV